MIISPWSDEAVQQICAFAAALNEAREAHALDDVDAAPAEEKKVEISTGSLFWMELHCAFPELQSCELQLVGEVSYSLHRGTNPKVPHLVPINPDDPIWLQQFQLHASIKPSLTFTTRVTPVVTATFVCLHDG